MRKLIVAHVFGCLVFLIFEVDGSFRTPVWLLYIACLSTQEDHVREELVVGS